MRERQREGEYMKRTAAKHALQTLTDRQRKLNSAEANRGESEIRELMIIVKSRTFFIIEKSPKGQWLTVRNSVDNWLAILSFST